MNILGIDALTYGVEDIDAAIRFHADWGLTQVGPDADFVLPDGTSVHIRRADDAALPPPCIDWAHLNGSTCREVVWGVDGAATLDAIGVELSGDREVAGDADGVLHTTDDRSNRIAFRVSRRRKLAVPLPDTNGVGAAGRHNRPAEGAGRSRAGPYRFGHVVMWTPGDFAAAAEFYIDRLGFRVTDKVLGSGVFLRCGASTDHHNLFLQSGGDYRGFQHVAYEFRDIDSVMLAGCRMEQSGWRTNVGPLRHNIGSSMSWYLWNPAGGLAEAYCDMDYADDSWQTREIDPRAPGFYGHAWNPRPEQAGRRPADLHDD